MRSITLDHMVANNKRPVRVASPLAMSHFVTASPSSATSSPTISTKIEKAANTSVSPRVNNFLFPDDNTRTPPWLQSREEVELDPVEEEKREDRRDELDAVEEEKTEDRRDENDRSPKLYQIGDTSTASDVETGVRDESSFDPFGIRILDETEEQGDGTYTFETSESDRCDESKSNEDDFFRQNESSFDPFDLTHSQIENVSPAKSSEDSSMQMFNILDESEVSSFAPPIVSHSFTQEQRQIHAAVERRNEHLEKENWELRRVLEKNSILLQKKNQQLLELEKMRKDMFLDLEMARSFGITLGRKLQLCTQERDKALSKVQEFIAEQNRLEVSDDSTVIVSNTGHKTGERRGHAVEESIEEILAPNDEVMDESRDSEVEEVGDGRYMV